jgi:soluble lytic murein transglycosylase-like protein
LEVHAPPKAHASPTPVVESPRDTIIPARRRLFERRVLFSTEYLDRLFAAAQRELTLSRDAATYAGRYEISTELARTILESAIAEGIDPELAFRVVRVESVFEPDARGPGGSLGLTQLMPATARHVDRSLRTEAQILDPVTNLRTGFRYLRAMIERYDDVRLGVLAYNRGQGTVDRALRAGRDPENGYSPKVLHLGGPYQGAGLITPEP